MPTGTVQRFDAKRGFGFIKPDVPGAMVDGKEQDVFVHQNNIAMIGFRSLQDGEKVEYDEEIGEKGPKAVNVKLLSERAPRPQRAQRNSNDRRPAGPRRGNGGGNDDLRADFNRLVQLLVDVDVINASEVEQCGLGAIAQQSNR